MHSNSHRNPGESAGIVIRRCALNHKVVVLNPSSGSFFETFLRQGLNIAQNIKIVMFSLLLFLLFFIMLHQSEAAIS